MYTIETKATFITNDKKHTFYLDKMDNGNFNIYRDERPIRSNLTYHTSLALFVKMAEENACIIDFN